MKKLHFFIMLFLIIPVTVLAKASEWLPGCISDGSCGMDQFWGMFVQIASWALGFLGVAVLCYFIYGGIKWLTSAGNSSKIQEGRNIMINTFIGMMIVLGSWLIVNTLIGALGGTELTSNNTYSTTIVTGCDKAGDVGKVCGGSKYSICKQNEFFDNSEYISNRCNGQTTDYNLCLNYDSACKYCSNRQYVCVNKCDVEKSGTCMDATTCKEQIKGTVHPNLCMGGNNIKCCVKPDYN